MRKLILLITAIAVMLSVGSLMTFAADPGDYRGYLDNGGNFGDDTRAVSPDAVAATAFTIGLNTESISISGWFLSDTGFKGMQYSVNGGAYKDLSPARTNRTDVLTHIPGFSAEQNPQCGFGVDIPTAELAAGKHEIAVRVITNNDAPVDFIDIDVTVDSSIVTDPDAQEVGHSFDNIFFDGEKMVEGEAGKYISSNYPDGINIKDAGITEAIGLRGWVGYKGAIKSFGYRINDKDTFGEFAEETDENVKGAGGPNAARFIVNVPVSALVAGTNEIKAIAKLESGTVVEIQGVEVTVINGEASQQGGETPPSPATGDTAMIVFIVAAAAVALAVLKKRAF